MGRWWGLPCDRIQVNFWRGDCGLLAKVLWVIILLFKQVWGFEDGFI